MFTTHYRAWRYAPPSAPRSANQWKRVPEQLAVPGPGRGALDAVMAHDVEGADGTGDQEMACETQASRGQVQQVKHRLIANVRACLSGSSVPLQATAAGGTDQRRDYGAQGDIGRNGELDVEDDDDDVSDIDAVTVDDDDCDDQADVAAAIDGLLDDSEAEREVRLLNERSEKIR